MPKLNKKIKKIIPNENHWNKFFLTQELTPSKTFEHLYRLKTEECMYNSNPLIIKVLPLEELERIVNMTFITDLDKYHSDIISMPHTHKTMKEAV